jgi:small-conductance mechanosensitive channel
VTVEEIRAFALQWFNVALDYFGETSILIQLGLIAVLFPIAWFLSNRVEPLLETRARNIKGMPGLLRVVIAFMRRFEWVFFILLLLLAYTATGVAGWPGSNYLIYSAMLLSSAWLLISVVSHTIRSRTAQKFFAWVAWLYAAAMILGIVDDVAAILDSAGFNIGGFRLSVLTALQAAALLGAALWLSFSIGNFFDRRIQTIDELTPSLRVLIGKIIRITLIIIAALVAMSGLGIDLTALTVLSGAVGVGIGFGLQKVVSNFISGIIILMDQSIKPGDTIELGQTFGWIRELRARFVSVVTRDGREYLIPNEDFITTQVINWSFSDKYVRLDVPFGVSYDANPHDVTRIAIEAAAAVDRVDDTRKSPVCWMTAFGDSALEFKLRFWITDPQQGLTNIRGKVLIALWDAFKENGINIPYPHREVILKTPVTVVEPQAGS